MGCILPQHDIYWLVLDWGEEWQVGEMREVVLGCSPVKRLIGCSGVLRDLDRDVEDGCTGSRNLNVSYHNLLFSRGAIKSCNLGLARAARKSQSCGRTATEKCSGGSGIQHAV